MYETVVRNLLKRKSGKVGDGCWYVETTTMFAPGEESVAEATFDEAESLTDGRKRHGEHRLLYDHRWGEVKDLSNEEELRQALTEAYGDAMEWMDLQSLVNQFYSVRAKVTDSRRYFLNAQTSTSDAWIAFEEWAACGRPDRQLRDRDMVTLGFDGAVRDDATAVVACRVSDGHLELLGCWERPEGPAGEDWQVPREEVDACIARAMRRFSVVGFFADPPHWQDYCDRWHLEYAEKMQVAATAKRPIEWWTNRPTPSIAMLERFYEAVLEERVSFTPPQDRVGRESELAATLTRHVLNARRRPHRLGMLIGKEHPKSAKKIDGCMAACLAFEAAQEAIAKGAKPARLMRYAAKRIR